MFRAKVGKVVIKVGILYNSDVLDSSVFRVIVAVTISPASDLGYLAPPGQFFMGAKLFIGTLEMRNEGVLKKIGMGYV